VTSVKLLILTLKLFTKVRVFLHSDDSYNSTHNSVLAGIADFTTSH